MQQSDIKDTPAEYHKDAEVGGGDEVRNFRRPYRGRGGRGRGGGGAFTSDNWRSDQYDFDAAAGEGRGGWSRGGGRGRGYHRGGRGGRSNDDENTEPRSEYRDPEGNGGGDGQGEAGAERQQYDRPYHDRRGGGRGGYRGGGYGGNYRGRGGRFQYDEDGNQHQPLRPYYDNRGAGNRRQERGPNEDNQRDEAAKQQDQPPADAEGPRKSEMYEPSQQQQQQPRGGSRFEQMNEHGEGRAYQPRRGGGGGQWNNNYDRGYGNNHYDRRDAPRGGQQQQPEEGQQQQQDDSTGTAPSKPGRVQRAPHLRQNCHDEDEVLALFASHHQQTGITLDNYSNIPVEMVPRDVMAVEDFSELSVDPALAATIERCGYKKPTPVQRFGIPVALAGNDLMACAQTGSGKTAAFLIPVIQYILVNGVSPGRNRKSYPIAIVMAPTRELALQIFDEVRKLAFRTDIMYEVAYGGTPYPRRYEIGVLVACPGRLKDIFDRGNMSFSATKFLILDEADRMLEMGFEEQIEYLVASSYTDMPPPENRQTLMFSATFPQRILTLAKRYLRKRYYLLTVGRVGSTTKNITQVVEQVEENEKIDRLFDIIFSHKKTDLVLVFVETKRAADMLYKELRQESIPSSTIHGDRSQPDRERALTEFKAGNTPILVATDVAARGLDIPNVTHVIQYDLPTEMDDYTHRIGRTGRAGNKGTATAFYNSKNRRICLDLYKYMTEHEQEVPRWFKDEAEQIEGEALLSRGMGGGRRGGAGGRRRDDDNSTWGESRQSGGASRGGGGGGGGSAGGAEASRGRGSGAPRKPTSAFADVDDGGF